MGGVASDAEYLVSLCRFRVPQPPRAAPAARPTPPRRPLAATAPVRPRAAGPAPTPPRTLGWVLGYAAVYEEPYSNGGDWRRVVAGAFDGAANRKVNALIAHATARVVASGHYGTLMLLPDAFGLAILADLHDSGDGRQLFTWLQAGPVGLSVSWSGHTRRERAGRGFSVEVVTSPATVEEVSFADPLGPAPAQPLAVSYLLNDLQQFQPEALDAVYRRTGAAKFAVKARLARLAQQL